MFIPKLKIISFTALLSFFADFKDIIPILLLHYPALFLYYSYIIRLLKVSQILGKQYDYHNMIR